MDKYYGDYLTSVGKYLDEIIKEYFPANHNGIFFDIGAYDPIKISNSYHFELNGWDTYCFEANPNLIHNLKKKRKNVFNCAISDTNKEATEFNIVYQNEHNADWNKVASFSSLDLTYFKLPCYQNFLNKKQYRVETIKVGQRTLNSFLANELKSIDNIDVLEIDIEGGEFNCLKGIDLKKYTPKVILLENMDNNQDIMNYLNNFNYKLDKKYHYNEFYVKNK
jgi:FkbM family methyltransferase